MRGWEDDADSDDTELVVVVDVSEVDVVDDEVVDVPTEAPPPTAGAFDKVNVHLEVVDVVDVDDEDGDDDDDSDDNVVKADAG